MLVSLNVVYVFAFIFYISSILVHVLTIYKVIPYTSVNGGRSQSYEDQRKQSKVSIGILFVMSVVVFSSLLFPNIRKLVIHVILITVLALFWTIGTIMQLLGSKLERYVLVWINGIGLFTHIQLVIYYFAEGE